VTLERRNEMKKTIMMAAAVLTVAWLPGAAMAQEQKGPGIRATMSAMTFERLDDEVAEFQVELKLETDQEVLIRQIVFKETKAAGIPVEVSAIQMPLRLKAGKAVAVPVRLKVKYRDLVQVQGLSDVVMKKVIPVRTTIEVFGEVPWVNGIRFFTKQVRLSGEVEEQVSLVAQKEDGDDQ